MCINRADVCVCNSEPRLCDTYMTGRQWGHSPFRCLISASKSAQPDRSEGFPAAGSTGPGGPSGPVPPALGAAGAPGAVTRHGPHLLGPEDERQGYAGAFEAGRYREVAPGPADLYEHRLQAVAGGEGLRGARHGVHRRFLARTVAERQGDLLLDPGRGAAHPHGGEARPVGVPDHDEPRGPGRPCAGHVGQAARRPRQVGGLGGAPAGRRLPVSSRQTASRPPPSTRRSSAGCTAR